MIRIAIVGIGNCAAALIEGIQYYKLTSSRKGVRFPRLGGYDIAQIEIVAAFDIDKRKVGCPLHKAIEAQPNCIRQISRINSSQIVVHMGKILDGVANHMKLGRGVPRIVIASVRDAREKEIVKILKDSQADLLLNYLPVGSEKATRFYAMCALKAGMGFINCIPVFIASSPAWARKFSDKGLPLIGDDIKSQLGATIIHRALVQLFNDRGGNLDNSYQLNIGGNTDFANMLDQIRLCSKRKSKTGAVTALLDSDFPEERIRVSPTDYVPWLKDRKTCFIRIEGRGFAESPMDLDLRLSIEDSPNSAGMVVDAIRCGKIALDRKLGGTLPEVSAWCCKHPPKEMNDREALRGILSFSRTGYSRAVASPGKRDLS